MFLLILVAHSYLLLNNILLLSKYLRVEWLAHMVNAYLAL